MVWCMLVCYKIFVLFVIGMMINYFDCIVLGVVVLQFIKEFGINVVVMGVMFFVFLWMYVVMQVFGGLFFDCFGSKIIYYWLMMLWLLCMFL